MTTFIKTIIILSILLTKGTSPILAEQFYLAKNCLKIADLFSKIKESYWLEIINIYDLAESVCEIQDEEWYKFHLILAVMACKKCYDDKIRLVYNFRLARVIVLLTIVASNWCKPVCTLVDFDSLLYKVYKDLPDMFRDEIDEVVDHLYDNTECYYKHEYIPKIKLLSIASRKLDFEYDMFYKA